MTRASSGRIGSWASGTLKFLVSGVRFGYDGAYAKSGYGIGVRRAAVPEECRSGTPEHWSGARGPEPRAITPRRGCLV